MKLVLMKLTEEDADAAIELLGELGEVLSITELVGVERICKDGNRRSPRRNPIGESALGRALIAEASARTLTSEIAKEKAEALGYAPSSAGSYLSCLTKSGHLRRVGRGIYKAAK